MYKMECCKLQLTQGILSQQLDNDFLQKYLRQIDSSSAKSVVLDLSTISFADSACIAFMVKLYKYCKKADKQFSLEHAHTEIKDIFHKMNLDRVIPIVD
jgi:anti-anti-sigma factor